MLAQLMQDCWLEDAAARPSFPEIVVRLKQLDSSTWQPPFTENASSVVVL